MVQVEEPVSSTPEPAVAPTGPPPSAPTFQLRWYPAIFVGLVIVGFLLRIHRLGERAIHHDESLHALYSWYLFVGRGYVHDPMMHGPWQFTFPALIYFLFGDSDFTARLGNTLFGTATIVGPYFLRREIGRTGAVIASSLLAISPAFLYFSRFAREDIYYVGWTMLMVVAVFALLRTRRERYLYLAAFGLAGAFATKEAIYITGFVWVSFFAILLTVFRRSEMAEQVRATVRAFPLSAWLKAVAITVAMDAVLFTTFFTNMGDPWNCLAGRRCTPGGLWTGTGGALLYWIAQHEVQRGGQPWFYYLILVPLYEFIPLTLAIAGLVWRRARRNLFFWFCLNWGIQSFIFFSYAGEKMPWITPHLVLPMLLFGSQALGAWLERLDLGRLAQVESRLAYGLGLLALAVTVAAVGLGAVQTLTPLERQSFLLEQLSYGLVLVGIVAGLVYLRRRNPRALTGAPLILAGLTAMLVFYVHTSWQLNYANGDVPKEMLVYVQSSPDVPQVVREIERIAFQTGQGKELRILMDNGYTDTVGGQTVVYEAVSWPFEWYLRNYTQRRYYSKTFGNDINLAEYPVALIMAPNLDPVRERLGDYNGQKYRLNWWYPEDYKGLAADPPRIAGVQIKIPWIKWDVIWAGLTDPTNRANLLKYLLYRETLQPLGAREFYFFARKEIPPLGPAPIVQPRPKPTPVPVSTAPRNAVLVNRPDGSAIFGRSADGAALLNQPKGVAVGPDGKLYVVEAGAHRLTIFNSDGTIDATWGRQGNGDNEFQEPWAVEVAANGDVFVADTWNHRILRFDASGKLLKKWGSMADTKGQVDVQTGRFWGPRDLAIGPDNRLYVSDTGNKRIQVFDFDGNFIRAFGGEGAEPGRLREPVGLFVNGSSLLVADTWNNRIQRFDLNGQPQSQLPVTAWTGQSLTNKPYVVVDSSGRLLTSAPDAGNVLVLGADGRPTAPIQPQGADGGQPGLPTGLAVGPGGEIYVTDSRQGVVHQLPPTR